MTSSTHTGRRLRRGAAIALGSALIAATLPSGVAAAQQTDPPYDRGTSEVCSAPYTSAFTDVTPANTHYTNILCMADYGLTEGVGGGTAYAPRLAVSRAQMASFIARFIEDATGAELPAGDPNRFGDRSSFVSPHRDNINKLAQAGVVQGTGDGSNYSPQLIVNRQQMASFIRNAVSYIDDGQVDPPSAPPAWTGGPIFNDAPFVTAHDANINAIAGVGIVQGNNARNYLPTQPVYRDQMASFVMRAYDYVASDEFGQDPDPTTSVTVNPTTVTAGGSVTVTFAGDVDRIDTVSAAGTCIAGGPLTLTAGSATIATSETAAGGTCTLTFTVTYDDGSTQQLTANVTVVGIPDPAADGEYRSGTIEVCLIVAEAGTTTIWAEFDEDGRVAFSGDAAQDTVIVDGDELDLSDGQDRLTFEAACTAGTTIDVDYDTEGPSTFELFTADADRVTNTTTRDNFSTITDAVAAADEDEVLEARGSFEETVAVDVDGLTLRAADDEDAALTGAIAVTADTVTIEGFDFDGYGGAVNSEAAVLVSGAADVLISGSTFTGDGDGDVIDRAVVLTPDSGNSVAVEDSTFTGNDTGVYINAGDADIDGNDFVDNVVGISNDGAGEVTITDNDLSGSSFEAIGLADTTNVTIDGNRFTEDNADHVCDYAGADGTYLESIEDENVYVDHEVVIGANLAKGGAFCLTPDDEG